MYARSAVLLIATEVQYSGSPHQLCDQTLGENGGGNGGSKKRIKTALAFA